MSHDYSTASIKLLALKSIVEVHQNVVDCRDEHCSESEAILPLVWRRENGRETVNFQDNKNLKDPDPMLGAGCSIIYLMV